MSLANLDEHCKLSGDRVSEVLTIHVENRELPMTYFSLSNSFTVIVCILKPP